jgi:hypothetical protein
MRKWQATASDKRGQEQGSAQCDANQYIQFGLSRSRRRVYADVVHAIVA